MLHFGRRIEGADAAGLRELALDHGQRSRSRLAATLDDGTAAAVMLPRGTVLRDGDVLEAEAGERVCVRALAQPLLELRADDPMQLARALYHLGNRHVPVQIESWRLLIEPDPVLERMLRGLGLQVRELRLPFDPEAGAHGGGHHHGSEADATTGLGERLSIEAHRARFR